MLLDLDDIITIKISCKQKRFGLIKILLDSRSVICYYYPILKKRYIMMKLNGMKVIDVEVDGVDSSDYPDFCDAYFSVAYYENGVELTDDELQDLQELYPEVINEMAYQNLITE